jgi:DNA adenine methylase
VLAEPNPLSDLHALRPSARIQPFLKWPGGKRWLVPTLLKFIEPYPFKSNYEPFLGGGAQFFALKPKRAFLTDVNIDLINVYRWVKYDHLSLIQCLRKVPVDLATFQSQRRRAPVPLWGALPVSYT